MPVLPFHRYIGPGNRSDNGEPVDEDDRIAREHDIRYDNAKSEEDVRRADIDAIVQFRRNWMEGNWHSLIGDIGLSFKYCVETFTGVLYPEVPEIVLSENEECKIIFVNNFLKLHCVFKHKRLLDQFKVNPFLSDEDKLKMPEILKFLVFTDKEITSLFPASLYVPLNWLEIYSKSQLNSIFQNEFSALVNGHFQPIKISNEKCKIITNYFHWQNLFDNIFIKRRSVDKERNGTDKSDFDFLTLIHSGDIYIDHDGNLHLENTN